MSVKSTNSNSSSDADIFLSIADTIHHITSLPVSIWAPNQAKTALNIVAAIGLPTDYIQTAHLDLDKPSVTGDTYKKQKTQIARDIQSDRRWYYKKQAREMNWKSAICVPIEVGTKIAGVISVYTYRERSISELEYILPDFAKQIGLTLDAGKRKEVLQHILDINLQIQGAIEKPQRVLSAIVKGACELMDANCAVVYPYDIERREFYDIKNVAWYGLDKPLVLSEKPRSKSGMAAYVKRRGEIVLTSIKEQDPEMLKTSEFLKREKIQAFMGIALRAKNEVLGILYVNYRDTHRFTQGEKDTIRIFAHQASIALNNARLQQRADSQIEALENLHEVGVNLTSFPRVRDNLRNILTRIARSAQHVLGAELVDVYQYFQKQDRYDLPPVLVGKRYDKTVSKTTIYKDDVINKIVKNKKCQYIANAQENRTLIMPFTVKRKDLPKKRFVIRENIKSTAAIPLMVGDEIVGIVFANYRSPQLFSPEQRKLIELFAHQASIAIWNARLFTDVQQRLKERLKDISAFQEIYEKMYGAKQEKIMSLIAKKAIQLTGSKYGVLWLVDKDRTKLTCAGAVGDKRPTSALPKLPLDKKSINGWVLYTGKPYLCNDTKSDQHYRNWYDDARSELAVPLLYDNKVIGTLDVESVSVNNFTDDHLELMKALANQAAIAIQNSQIIKKLDTLDDVGQALTGAIRLREQEILELIYKKASGLMDTNNMYIALYDERTDIVRFGLAFVGGKRIDIERNKDWQPRKGGKGKTEEIIRTRQPVFTATRKDAEDWYAQPGRKEYMGFALPSWVGVPMILGDKVIGVIATYHPTQEHVYSHDDLDILQSMAIQAAVAIDNSRMFYDINQRLNALVKFEQEVTSVIHSGENKILKLIHEQVSQLMDTQNFYIALYDKPTNTIRFGLAFRDGKRIDWPSRKAGKGKTEVILNSQKHLFHATYAESKAWYTMPEHKEYVGDISSSWLGVPMTVGGKVIGVIGTYHLTKEYLYDGNDLEFLQAMANQAAVALDNARSFIEAQNRIEDLETIDSIIQTINTKVGSEELVQTIVSQIREHLQCAHCAIFFSQKIGDKTILTSKFTYGEFAEAIKTRSFEEGEGLTGWVFKHGKTALVLDASLDERFSPARAREYEPRSLLVVPVSVSGKTVGVISADHNRIAGFDENDLRLVETLAGHISIALEKARLYQEARSDAIAAKQLATLGTAIAALQHRINNTLNIIVPNIKRLQTRVDMTDSTIKEILDIIERNTRYTSGILMRIQTPLQEVESSSVDINSLLNDIVGKAKKDWGKDTSHPTVKIKLELDDSIPLIQLPVGQISEIIRNLIDNAYRAMKRGGKITIISKLENNTIYIQLKDTAEGGIPPAIQERLFQKPVPSKEPGHGAGLGLWLSKLMLQGVGGDVRIEDTGPTGTTMLIQIPVSASGKEAAV